MGTRASDTRRFRNLAAMLRRERRTNCWLCLQPIDYDAPPNEPDAFSADHILPVSTHPDLVNVYSNLAASHSSCNKARGNRMPQPGIGSPEPQW